MDSARLKVAMRKAAGGQLVDQRFCPRIVEGELRYNCVGPKLVGIIHKKPKEGGIFPPPDGWIARACMWYEYECVPSPPPLPR